MTTEDLNTKLYQKMVNEYEDFKDMLRGCTPDEIISKAYEYVVKEAIIFYMEDQDLSDARAKALLKTKKPLEAVFQKWDHMDNNCMDFIRDAIEAKADDLIQMKKRDQPEFTR